MSTTPVTATNPTAPRYQCGSGCGTITFEWGRRTPENGRLGTVTFGQYVNKPIQVFDRREIRYGDRVIAHNWAFQAQDGSFLGRMLVTAPSQSFIRFAKFRAGDQWPQVSCSVPVPAAGESLESIENVQ
jgi:hypothetical protein